MTASQKPPSPTHIDASGVTCPMPLLLLKWALEKLSTGSQVVITVTDPHAELDFETWCERFSHGLEKVQDNDGIMVFTVVKNNTEKLA